MNTPSRAERDDSERLFYMGAGPLAAILLGAALVPLRDFTPASNFTFAFLVLTIVAAELGGRGPGIATALVSALSLDFFLTRPYMKLSIEGKDDIIAFVGLGACGLVAAAMGSRRGADPDRGNAVREHLKLLREAIRELDGTPPLEPAFTRALSAARATLPLSAAVVRDIQGAVLASANPEDRARPAPPRGRFDASEAEVPAAGVRIALTFKGGPVGWLDVWGDGRRWDAESRATLASLAALVAWCLSGGRGDTI